MCPRASYENTFDIFSISISMIIQHCIREYIDREMLQSDNEISGHRFQSSPLCTGSLIRRLICGCPPPSCAG